MRWTLSGKCIGPAGASTRVKYLDEIIDKWQDNPRIRAIGNTEKHFTDFFFRVTGNDYDFGDLPSMGSLRKLNKKVDRIITDLGKGKRGFFPKWFFLPEEILSKNPIARKVFNGLFIAHNHFRGRSERNESNLVTLTKQLRDASASLSISENHNFSFNKARKHLARAYDDYRELVSNGRMEDAKDYKADVIVPLLKQSEFKVFEMADELFRNPKLIETAEGASKYALLIPALNTWKKMSSQLYLDLSNGLNYYIDVIKLSANENNNMAAVANRVEKLRDILIERKNYLPVQALEIFPMFSAMSEKMYEGKSNMETETGLLDMAKNMIDIASGQVKPSGHIFPQSERGPGFTDYSKDIISVLDTYSKNVARFNLYGKATLEFVSGIKGLSRLEGTVLEKQAQFMADYLFDTHASLLGLGVKSQRAINFARTVTAWQFISKLGLNLRTATRNATQSVHNFTYFGVKGIWDAVSFIKGENINDIVNFELQKHGLQFKEARELTSPFSMFPQARSKVIDGKEVFYYDTDSFGSKFSDKLEQVARITGKPMQWVENNINRNWTFKIAFGKYYRELSKNKGTIEQVLKKKAESALSSEELSRRVNQMIVRRSSNFAANMVKELHYEYSPFAKPKVLRTPTGAIMGQFATYSINFFNFNRKIIMDAKDEVMSGYWGEGAWRAMRLASIYFMVEAIISPIFNANMGSLVQHDTMERITALHEFLTADTTEEKQKAYYGKGPIIGTIGGPAISDLVTLGNVFGVMKLSEDNYFSMLAGYQDLSNETKDAKVGEIVRLINTQIYRLALIDLPKIWDGGNAGVQFWYDVTGAYPSKELRERKEKHIVPIAKSLGIRAPKDRSKPKKKWAKVHTQSDIIRALNSL